MTLRAFWEINHETFTTVYSCFQLPHKTLETYNVSQLQVAVDGHHPQKRNIFYFYKCLSYLYNNKRECLA